MATGRTAPSHSPTSWSPAPGRPIRCRPGSTASKSVRKLHAGLHSFRSMRRMEARRKKASGGLRLRHSQAHIRKEELASAERQRRSAGTGASHSARVRSTIQRLGRTDDGQPFSGVTGNRLTTTFISSRSTRASVHAFRRALKFRRSSLNSLRGGVGAYRRRHRLYPCRQRLSAHRRLGAGANLRRCARAQTAASGSRSLRHAVLSGHGHL